MKLGRVFLLFLALSAAGLGKEIFEARAIPALATGETVWRVESARHGLVVRLTHLGKRFTAHLPHAESQVLRVKIAGLRLSPADMAALHAREVHKDGLWVLRPFDGVTYRFKIRGEEILAPNPSHDFKYHAPLEETARLGEVMDMLPELTRIASKERAEQRK